MTMGLNLAFARKEPAQARNFNACTSIEDVFVDVTWSVCISIKQFNIEFKVRYEFSSYSSILTSLVAVIFIFYMYIVLFL